jgi:branched-chain amino acid transport system substrate-binding protein
LVRLIYDDQVWAVVGAVGGRSAHLAAQVVARAKGQVVFVTPAATDPSLTRIKLPWFFRLVPDDRQQAAALVREIFDFRGLKRVGLIVEEGYDSRTAASAFAKAAPANATVVFSVGQGQKENELIEHLRQSGAEGLVFFVRASTAAKWVRLLRGHGMSVPFFGPLGLAAADFERRAGSAAEGTVFVISNSPRGLETSQSLEWSPWESYGDDSVTVIVQAIRQGGLHRSAIREAVAGTEFVGLTGPIRFGPDGGRQGRARLGRLQERRLVALALR